MRYDLGAHLDIGHGRKRQEDYLQFSEFGNGLLAVIADGTGTADEFLQPAVLAVNGIVRDITELGENKSELFRQDPLYFMKLAMENANRMIGMLKLANEERYFGYAASVTALYLAQSGDFYYAHAGNTRLYLMRTGNLIQLTEDHTVGMQKIGEGTLREDQYYITDDRLKMTSGVGLVDEPTIYLNQGKVKENDILLMTTDGVHYAVQTPYMVRAVLESDSVVNAAQNLVYMALSTQYPDNMGAIVIGVTGEE